MARHRAWLSGRDLTSLFQQRCLQVLENRRTGRWRLQAPHKLLAGHRPKSFPIEPTGYVDTPDHAGGRTIELVVPHTEDMKDKLPDRGGWRIPLPAALSGSIDWERGDPQIVAHAPCQRELARRPGVFPFPFSSKKISPIDVLWTLLGGIALLVTQTLRIPGDLCGSLAALVFPWWARMITRSKCLVVGPLAHTYNIRKASMY